VDSASTLVEQLKITQLTALDTAPQEVKDSQWYKDFRNGVNNFNRTGKQPLSPHLQVGKLACKHMRHCSSGSSRVPYIRIPQQSSHSTCFCVCCFGMLVVLSLLSCVRTPQLPLLWGSPPQMIASLAASPWTLSRGWQV